MTLNVSNHTGTGEATYLPSAVHAAKSQTFSTKGADRTLWWSKDVSK